MLLGLRYVNEKMLTLAKQNFQLKDQNCKLHKFIK